jgi:CRP-like cAMP-binding protein
MKVLHREDVEEAGYDMPNTGICANIPEFDLEELKFAGEWVLVDDEVVVGDGRTQQFLYMVASGQVDVYKRSDQSSQHQHIATIPVGDAFGEMAFLSGGVASADVQATGQAVLWRIDHERLLEFVGQHRAGGQLCMNIASTLSNRLVGGNRQLVELGKKLQESMQQLRTLSTSDGGSKKALTQMQNRVTGVTNAFRGQEVAKTKLGAVGISGMVAAAVLLVALIISQATRPDGNAEQETVSLKKQLDELTDEHVGLVVTHKGLRATNDELQQHFEETQRKHRMVLAGLSSRKENPLPTGVAPERPTPPTPSTTDPTPPIPPVVEVPTVQPSPTPSTGTPVTPEAPSQSRTAILNWARTWSTVAFPMQVKALKPFTLEASANSGVGIPMTPGKSLYALELKGEELKVGLKPNSNTFTKIVPVDSTNFVVTAKPRFEFHAKRLEDRRKATPTNASPFPAPPTSGPTGKNPPVKPKPVDTSDHGKACVCKDCRVKKKGGSLFQFPE